MPERLDDVAYVRNNFMEIVREVRKQLVTRMLLQTVDFVHLHLLVNLLLVGRLAALVIVFLLHVLLVKDVHHRQMDTVG